MRTQGVTYEKAKAFAIEVIALCNELRLNHRQKKKQYTNAIKNAITR